jgi:predicted AlkP superfamily pyrophosphatase or phosphodiesterase
MMNKLILIALIFFNALFANNILAQTSPTAAKRPKLVIGIVVDQMRYDFLYKYQSKYSKGGFMRLMREGFNARNLHYNYAPTVTGAGHTAIFTGSVPSVNGIVGNDWYDRKLGRTVYVAEDNSVNTVGSSSMAGKMSPRNMLSSTIADQLRIAQNFKNKTIGIALKDRGAIMPAGHSANAAYWFDSSNGAWISSSFYLNELPTWAQEYNALKEPHKVFNTTWNTLLPIAQYTEAEEDNQPYESKLNGEVAAVFPHELIGTRGNLLETLRSTPAGNTITKNFALAAIEGEKLGQSGSTDFLTLSFSSPDYAGHAFGPQSVEVQDIYLRLDRDIEEILNKLDLKLGKGNYLVFLSADHGVADIPAFWQKHLLPAGVRDYGFFSLVKSEIKRLYADSSLVLASDNSQLYLDHKKLAEKKLSTAQIVADIKPFVMQQAGVADVLDLHNLSSAWLPEVLKNKVINGLNAHRSGDIMILQQPQWILGRATTGTTHSSLYNYDTHVPALFFGWGVARGESAEPYNISDIAPTIANILSILEPSGNIGRPIKVK